ncbi:MAG: carbohydrate kinase family protein [Anaerolineales bacterium]|nr:carbohydrate kinase family protein [Anaerolineales bacterium]NUQ84320.1 carbohydrate kinase family protein [Anaerolineales bacterium]
MDIHFIVFGRLTREFLLPAAAQPRLDAAGGSLLYASAGLGVWESGVGLVGRVGNDYPRAWLNEIRARGFDTSGVHILPQNLDVREFVAYNESFEANRVNPVSHFARRQMTVPKSLLGYQADKKPDEALKLTVRDIPDDYLTARAAYLCPMDLVTQTQLIAGLKRGHAHSFILDPAPASMTPTARRELPALLNGVTAFLPSEEELRNLFQAETHDLWEMAEAVSLYGCEYVVIKRGAHGQLLYDADAKRRWEIPAYPSRVEDVTGAGDAFGGGFVSGFCKNYDPLEGVLHGNVSASLKLEGYGAFHPLEVLPGLAKARLEALRELVRRV